MRYRLSPLADGGASLWLWCPGCDDAHRVNVLGDDGSSPEGPVWDWIDRLDCITLHPSIKVTGVQWAPDQGFHKPRHHVQPGEQVICHSFVTDGEWRFLPDSTHELAGQTVALPDLPEWLASTSPDLTGGYGRLQMQAPQHNWPTEGEPR